MSEHVLRPEVYYRLRWLQAEQERDAARLLLVQAKAQEAERRYRQALADAGRESGFDPSVPLAWNDANHALVAS